MVVVIHLLLNQVCHTDLVLKDIIVVQHVILLYRLTAFNNGINYTVCNVGSCMNDDINSDSCILTRTGRFKFTNMPNYTVIAHYRNYAGYLYPSLDETGNMGGGTYPAISTYKSDNGINYKTCNIGSVTIDKNDAKPTGYMAGEGRFKYNNTGNGQYTAIPIYNTRFGGFAPITVNANGMASFEDYYTGYPAISIYDI